MPAILPFLHGNAAFDPEATRAMSTAFDDVCRALKVDDAHARESIAMRIIDLARRGERDPVRLRDRVLKETESLSFAGPTHPPAWFVSPAVARIELLRNPGL